jgi:asparagine synthase (glutamine-hydrolysing)
MCGIAGLADFTRGPIDRALLDTMVDSVGHRGPDGAGAWVGGTAAATVGFGHCRLAVIDLSDTASQPMQNTRCESAGRAPALTIVFNGEIYNYEALRAQLVARGHSFASHSDTEVILHLYEEAGPACVRLLRGMFAFAIWDAAANRVFCARDRAGKKPLYYRHDGARFWFSSEPRAILRDPRVPSEVNPDAVHAFLALGYVPGDSSAHAALKRLPPAHTLVADSRGVRVERYWRLNYQPKLDIPEVEALEELERLIAESVRLRLVSDVPIGAFLSGGIDSAVVVAMMARQSGRPVETFSIGFDDQEYNELPQARLVATRYGTSHHELIVKPDAVSLLPRLAWHYGEPFADSSSLPTYHLAQLVRREITVALNGDGGDESFAGYRRYWAHQMALRYESIPRLVRRGLEVAAASIVRASSGRSAAYDVQRFFARASYSSAERYAGWFGFFDEAMLAPSFVEHVRGRAVESLAAAFDAGAGLHPVEAAMSADVTTYLPDDLLVKVDIATMAHGLEARSPLLDHHVMEFAAGLPLRFKLRGRRGKYLLRQLARPLVPPEIVDGPKRGFGVPLDRWFRRELKEMAVDVLTGPTQTVAQYVSGDTIRRLLAEHASGDRAHGHRLWALLMLELWHRTCLDAAHPILEESIHA